MGNIWKIMGHDKYMSYIYHHLSMFVENHGSHATSFLSRQHCLEGLTGQEVVDNVKDHKSW